MCLHVDVYGAENVTLLWKPGLDTTIRMQLGLYLTI